MGMAAGVDRRAIERMVKEAVSLGKKTLAEPDAKEILRLSGLPVPRFCVVKDVSAAEEAASSIGYPVALKVVSSDIPHKSDVGGVALNINSPAELSMGWSSMILTVAEENPIAVVEGFLVEEMAPAGVEVIIGAMNDAQFGPAVMFGTGGVAVELMRDVSFRLAPLSEAEALEMMAEVKGFPLLTGFRGAPRMDVMAVAGVISRLSETIGLIDGLREIEINPLFVYEDGVIAVDARAALG